MLLHFFRTVQATPAIDAARKLLVCFGTVYLVTFVLTLHWYMWGPAAAFFAFGWFILYQIEIHPKRDFIQRVIENSTAFRRTHGNTSL